MRQFSAGNQWLSAGGKVAFEGQDRATHAHAVPTGLSVPAARGATRSGLLQVQPAHEIPLAQRNAVGAQDVVGGGSVEVEIGQRKRHQKPLCDKEQLALAEV